MNMQHLKRCFSLVLILALMLTAMPVQAFADTFNVSEISTEEIGEQNDEEIVEAAEEVQQYIVVFYDTDGTVLKTVTVDEGMLPEYEIPTKDPDEYGRYEFSGWDPEVSEAYSDAEYYAVWDSIKQYTVSFQDWDGTVLKEIRVDENGVIADTDIPENPEREADTENTYTFIGWDKDTTVEITENTTITAVYESKDIPVNVTFKTGENGSYTVNGEAVEEEKVEATTTKTSFSMVAAPADGYDFFGWYDGDDYISEDIEYTFKPLADMEIRPVFVKAGSVRLAVGDEYFNSFDEAVAAAKKSEDKTIVLMNDAILEAGEYEIPEGITLLIPCDEERTVYAEEPACIDETWVSPSAYRTLTLAEDAKLVINGALSLASPHVPAAGSKENGGSPHRAYGLIVTEDGSSITVNDGGVLYAYGYITGNGSITAKNGSNVYEYFQIMDFRGGSATTSMITSGYGVLPINQYYVQNIEIPLTLEAGANEYCYTSAKMSGNILSSSVGFIGTGKDAMFKLTSGTMTKWYDGKTDRLMAVVNGDMSISPITIDIGNRDVSSEDFVLPINGNITIEIESGSVNITQDVALTPGAKMIIDKGATCTLGDDSNIYVYDSEQWGKYSSSNQNTFVDLNYAPGKEYTRTDADLVDAVIQVDGTLDASKGYVYTTAGGASICSTDSGKIILRIGDEDTTYQFQYTGADGNLYGIYHEIPIVAAMLKNDGEESYVNQTGIEGKNIINYEYKDGVWTTVGHAYRETLAEEPTCLIEGCTYGTECAYGEDCEEHWNPSVKLDALGHSFTVEVEAKEPTYTSVGWEAHLKCDRCGAKDPDTYVEIDKLEGAVIDSYDEFVENLEILENWADEYVSANPGKDPAALVIKYIRTGVERYNSGSWGIMAGYEDTGFAAFVAEKEDKLNSEAASAGKELLKVSGLKNLINFQLPNGDEADFGHMFGTMDITYNNNFGVNHADVAGWAGDITDLLSIADQFGTGEAETINEMADYIYDNYLFKETEEIEDEFGEELKEGSFSLVDMYGDLDGYYVMKVLEGTEYEAGVLTAIIKEYFTETLNAEQRADFFLANRMDDTTLRVDLRAEVYKEYANNSVIATLEGTRDFESEDLSDLREACCYAFADYICKMAGDYVESVENEYMTVYASTSSTLAPGITQKTYQAKSADNQNMRYYTATIDVTRDDVHVYANYHVRNPENENWNMMRVIDQANAAQERYGNSESEEYIENYNVIAAINGSGYNMSTGEPGGLLMMDGIEWHAWDNSEFFGILSDGTAIIGNKADYEKLKAEGKLKEALGGFGTALIKDGKVAISATSDYYTNRASRTAIGITKTGKVVFMVLDGRQGEFSCGGSMEEIAQIMLDAGCEFALNLDGGGSSTYAARQEGETEISLVSNPSDGVQRSVSTSMIAVSTAPSSTEFDHAVIESPYGYLSAGSSVQLSAVGVSATNNSVELPEGLVWAVEDTSIGTVTEEGVFTAKSNGDVDVNLMLGEEVVGSLTLHVVTPDNVYFTKVSSNAVFEQTIDIPVKAVYKNKEVAINTNDIKLTLSDSSAGKIDGFKFVIGKESELKSVKITAALTANENTTATYTVYLYKQGEASFDFDQATGGTRQFAWDRVVSNSTTEDELTYAAVDVSEEMKTSYTFAIDMSKIDIPEQLEDLTYMLPGADLEGASAWTFLCQLAERMSDLTEVKAVVEFDKNVNVDWKNVTLVNDYFILNGKDFDEESNTLTLTLNWKKQTVPIDVTMANPICILSGIKVTPKDDAEWSAKDQLEIVNTGSISYTVYMRASGLYSFSSKESNQKIYGLYAYQHPENENEKGGYFTSVYTDFTDSYTLDKSVKNGWVGLRYYENGKMYTGIKLVDEYYYNFGEDGVVKINNGDKRYTGSMIDEDGNEYYIQSGKTMTGWILFGNDWSYYNPETGIKEKITAEIVPSTCIKNGTGKYTSESGAVKEVVFDDKAGHEYEKNTDGDYVCTETECGWVRVDMEDVDITLSFNYATYTGNKIQPAVTAVNPRTGEVMRSKRPLRDYYVEECVNNVEVGKATMTLIAARYGIYANMQEWRGNYAGRVSIDFYIYPDGPKEGKGTYNEDGTVTLSWNAAKTADGYAIYQSVNGGEYEKVGTSETTTYTVADLDPANAYRFRIRTVKTGTDGEVYESKSYTSINANKIVLEAKNNEATGKVALTWSKVTGAAQYEIHASETENGVFEKIGTTTGRSWTDANAKSGKEYFYKVRAITEDGTTLSRESNVASQVCDLAKVTGLKAVNVAKTGKIKITWSEVEGADKYAVYSSTSKDGEFKRIYTTTGTSCINKSAVAGKTYYYKVKAIDADNPEANSAMSGSYAKTCDLAKVTGLKAVNVAKTGKIKITWSEVEGADKYVVYSATSKNGKYTKIFTTAGTSCLNRSAVAGKTYYYKVQAIDADNSAANSALSGSYAKTCDLARVTGVKAVNIASTGKIKITWSEVKGADKYVVYSAASKNGKYSAIFTTKGTSCINKSAVAGKTYYYKVQAVDVDNSAANSAMSDSYAKTCDLARPDVTAKSTVKNQVKLTWKKVGGAEKYEVYRATSKNGTYKKLTTVTGTSYTNKSLTSGKTYYYKVRAIDADKAAANSAYSTVDACKCK